jgi:hypothetical protein
MMNNNDKTAALAKIAAINAVEGFDPTPLAVDYSDMNIGETRKRLPVMAQVAWFRLKYPEGRFTINVTAGKDCFVATARVYKNYMDPVECYLSEATASRGYLPDKPTVSPREWAQTAALGIALRNAGFGLQFHAAGESFDEPAVNELGQLIETPAAGNLVGNIEMPAADHAANNTSAPSASTDSEKPNETSKLVTISQKEPDEELLESALKMPCPIGKYKGKTLGDMITIDPNALVWVANKFTGDTALNSAAKLICDQALAATV